MWTRGEDAAPPAQQEARAASEPPATGEATPVEDVATEETAVTPPAASTPLEDVALGFARAAFAGDRGTALSLTLAYIDLLEVAPSVEQKTGAEGYDERVREMLDQLAREGADGKLRAVGVKVVQRSTAPSKDDLELELAVIQLVIEQDGRPARAQGLPFLFVRTKVGWRWSPIR